MHGMSDDVVTRTTPFMEHMKPVLAHLDLAVFAMGRLALPVPGHLVTNDLAGAQGHAG